VQIAGINKVAKSKKSDSGNLQLLCPKFVFYAWQVPMDEEDEQEEGEGQRVLDHLAAHCMSYLGRVGPSAFLTGLASPGGFCLPHIRPESTRPRLAVKPDDLTEHLAAGILTALDPAACLPGCGGRLKST
jgi:hypothetical protein